MENLTNPIVAILDDELIAENEIDSAPVIYRKQEAAKKIADRIKTYMESIVAKVSYESDDYGRDQSYHDNASETEVETFISNNTL